MTWRLIAYDKSTKGEDRCVAPDVDTHLIVADLTLVGHTR